MPAGALVRRYFAVFRPAGSGVGQICLSGYQEQQVCGE